MLSIPAYFPLSNGAVGNNSPTVGANSTTGSGLDCNGYSNVYYNLHPFLACTDPLNHEDNGYYIGHDEPSVQFLSTTAGSGNNMVWQINLPKTDPTPTQNGSKIANFELYPAFWFSLALCDPKSYPQNACTKDSDSNTGTGLSTDAGSAVLELQFYPPGWQPFITQVSCSSTQWCAALNIDSLECNYGFVFCNPSCTEPVNFAFLQTNGVPAGPPGPGKQTASTFTPNTNTLMMNPGDKLKITIKDTSGGLKTLVKDLSTGTSGFMIASASNRFLHTSLNTCATSSFSFHPEYSSAKSTNIVPWAALRINANFAVETGHFELGSTGDSDADDSPCFPGPTVAGCLAFAKGGDTDFDGTPYSANWPDGTLAHPSSVIIGASNGKGVGPMSFVSGSGYSNPYTQIQFETDVPFSEPQCHTSTGSGCTVPPVDPNTNTTVFYPFYSQSGTGSTCRFNFGNDIGTKTVNDFGKTAEYGTSQTNEPALFASGAISNPCIP